MAVIDMDSVGSFQVYPSGTYKVQIVGWEFGKSSKKQTPQVCMKCKIVEGEHTGKPYNEFLVMTDAAGWKIGSFIANCGVNTGGKLDTEGAVFRKILDVCIGRTMFITIEEDTSYGNNKSSGYATDIDQQPIEFTPTDDAPEFVK